MSSVWIYILRNKSTFGRTLLKWQKDCSAHQLLSHRRLWKVLSLLVGWCRPRWWSLLAETAHDSLLPPLEEQREINSQYWAFVLDLATKHQIGFSLWVEAASITGNIQTFLLKTNIIYFVPPWTPESPYSLTHPSLGLLCKFVTLWMCFSFTEFSESEQN